MLYFRKQSEMDYDELHCYTMTRLCLNHVIFLLTVQHQIIIFCELHILFSLIHTIIWLPCVVPRRR